MKRLLCVVLILVSLSSSLLFSGCQKQADVEASLQDKQAAITVVEAEAWFSNTVVKKEKEMLAQTYTVVPEKSSSRLFARMAKLQHKLLWQDAEVVNKQGLQFMVVPVTANKQLRSSEYEMSRAFVFYKNKDNKMSMNVVELMSEKGKNLDGRSGDIIAAAFYNRMAAAKETVPGVNATVFFYNDAYQSQDSYTMRNGVWISVNMNLQITTREGAGLKGTENINTEADGCTRWYIIQSHYEDGILVSWEILYSYQECPQGGGGTNTDPQTEDPYGSGGGATNPAQTRNVQISLSESETGYTEEDELSTGGYSPITYTYQATVTEVDPSGEVLNVLVYPTTATPMIGTYVDKYNRTVTRRLTLFNHYNNWFPIGASRAQVRWSCSVIGVYTYIDGSPTWTRQWSNTKSAIYN